MRIYLDYNLFAYLHDGTRPELNAKVSALSGQHLFPYSPAHMEEIATALAQSSSATAVDRLIVAIRKIGNVSRFSHNTELFPADSGPMVVKKEHPLECFRRVVLHYDRNAMVEESEEQMLASFKVGDPHGDLANKMSNLSDDFLIDSHHGRHLRLKLLFRSDLPFICKAHGVTDISWPEISEHFPVLERAIELAMNFLESVRYRPEQVKKSRSRIHDVTHCIYASGCEEFVTNDKRLYDKVRAAYRFFGIPTRVLMLEEFLAGDY